ncbi:MAG: hypothetical protein H0U76_25395 [Ktedonobacteraceae bacterium]|nr:hypothetical protein [Ktedonobacteraceae bacterium]
MYISPKKSSLSKADADACSSMQSKTQILCINAARIFQPYKATPSLTNRVVQWRCECCGNVRRVAQGYARPASLLHERSTSTFDPKTYRIQPNWRATDTLQVGANWLSGIYLIKVSARSTLPVTPEIVRPPP